MKTRSAELRRRHRRVMGWSLGIAVLAHALVLFFGPWFRSDPLSGGATELAEGTSPAFGGIAINVIFDPPAIVDDRGTLSREPAWRVLSASRVLPPPLACASQDWFARDFAKGEVNLAVDDVGRPETVELSRSTGDRCWDAVMVGLASDLRYRWLPNERFAAPVDVYQPVTLSLTGY